MYEKDKKIGNCKKGELLDIVGVMYYANKGLNKALDKACEELNEWCLSCGGIDEELHGVYPNFKTKEEWKEWCLKDVE